MKLSLRKEKIADIRAENLVPGVVYGKKIDSTPIQVDYKEFMQHYHEFGKSMTFKAKLDGKTHQVYIKDVQIDPIQRQNVLHFDLIKVTAKDTMTANIPIYLIDKERVEEKGLIVQQIANTVLAEYAVGKGVTSFQINVGEMDVGDTQRVKDIELPEGLKILDDPEKMIINVTEPTYEDEPVEDEDMLDEEEEDVEVEAIKQKSEEPKDSEE